VSKPLERREATSPLPFNFLYQKGAKRMIEPLTDIELDMMRGLESPITLDNKNQLIATIDVVKEERNSLARKLNQHISRREFLLEEENEKLEADLITEANVLNNIIDGERKTTCIIIEAFKAEIIELKDKIDNLKAEGYFE
jgi:hypothetical protein